MKRRVITLLVCLVALVGCSLGASDPRARATQWAEAVSIGDFATARDLMRVDIELEYVSWHARTRDLLAEDRLGKPHIMREAVRGATQYYCVQFGGDVGDERPVLHTTISTDSEGLLVVPDAYTRGDCPRDTATVGAPVGDRGVDAPGD
jgi:hypothetical protein